MRVGALTTQPIDRIDRMTEILIECAGARSRSGPPSQLAPCKEKVAAPARTLPAGVLRLQDVRGRCEGGGGGEACSQTRRVAPACAVMTRLTPFAYACRCATTLRCARWT